MSLPAARQVITGRTFSQRWDAASYGSALELPPRRRTSTLDVLGWLASIALIVGMLTMPYWAPR